MPVTSISLIFVEGTSNKQYDYTIEDRGGLYDVIGHYGRRGSTFKETVCATGLPLDDAKAALRKLVNERTRKGYVVDPDATQPFLAESEPLVERNDTGLRPQLLVAIDEPEDLLADDAWVMQEKHDGVRLLAHIDEGNVTTANRRGLRISVSDRLVHALAAFPGDHVLDGEYVDGVYHVFDIASPAAPYKDRLQLLELLLRQLEPTPTLQLVETYTGSTAKRQAFAQLQRFAEGVVFKRLDASYRPGKPASAGSQRKFKFWESCSCIVAAHNEKSSIALTLLDEAGARIDVGNVTVKANQATPPIGTIVEVRYLYAYQGGSLYQPELLGVRNDIPVEECTVDQLKYTP